MDRARRCHCGDGASTWRRRRNPLPHLDQELAEAFEDNRKVAWLYRVIAELEETLRETALLVLAEALSHAEAAKILGCAESTVSWRMHEVRKLLKQRVDTYP